MPFTRDLTIWIPLLLLLLLLIIIIVIIITSGVHLLTLPDACLYYSFSSQTAFVSGHVSCVTKKITMFTKSVGLKSTSAHHLAFDFIHISRIDITMCNTRHAVNEWNRKHTFCHLLMLKYWQGFDVIIIIFIIIIIFAL